MAKEQYRSPETGWPEGCGLKDSFKKVELNRYGYYQLRNMNTPEERRERFEKAYFQEYAGSTYAKKYEEDELQYMQTQYKEKAYIIEENLKWTGAYRDGRYTMLDVGCGEGFLLKFFRDRGALVKGIDFGSYALEYHNPSMMDAFTQGNMDDLLPQMAAEGETFDVINMDRVLDMVLDPESCLRQVGRLMEADSILVIKVANNYTHMQQMLLNSGELTKEHWLDEPDHTGYFNREGLLNLLDAMGYVCIDFYADTFVDLHLLNPLTNYYEKPETGKQCHKATVRLENLMCDISLQRLVEVSRNLSEMGFGREIVGVFRKKKGPVNGLGL